MSQWLLLHSGSLTILLLLAGCGSQGPETVDVKGRITVNGAPIEGLQVYFRPSDGPQAIGVTDADGTYELLLPGEISGVPPGACAVAIVGRDPRLSAEGLDELKAAEKESESKTAVSLVKLPVIPSKYNDRTELVANVSKTSCEFNFDLVVTKRGKR